MDRTFPDEVLRRSALPVAVATSAAARPLFVPFPMSFFFARVLLVLVCSSSVAFAANAIPAEHRIGGFAIGPQAYSFRFFTLFEAIEKAEQTGSKVIELGVGLQLSAERPVVF